MGARSWFLILAVASAMRLVWGDPPAPIFTQPEQVHIAYGDGSDPGQMWVVWNTVNTTTTSTVRLSAEQSGVWKTVTGTSRAFKDGGSEQRVQHVHRVLLQGLTPGQTYEYMCGSSEAWSNVFRFRAMPSGTEWSPRLVLYGDLGNVNAQSLPRLQLETQQDMYDAVLHVGDFAYDMETDNARVGDEFMRQIEPIAANLPYMTCPGNHEQHQNFTNYRHRFVMPGDELSDRMFYSFNIGPAHIISFNTEYYFYVDYGMTQPVKQFQWLEDDLKEASSAANRAKRPWIITMAHRPMYCSNSDKDDCTKEESIIRTGWPVIHSMALEPLFYKYGVDLQLWAHEHSYERLWPVYDRKVYNGSSSEPYTNPGAPVHIITGSAGCQENTDKFLNRTADWSAFRSSDYGYTRMTIHNSTHIYIEQVSDDQNGAIIDRVWVKKDNHGPYPPREWRAPDMMKMLGDMKKKGYRMFDTDSKGL